MNAKRAVHFSATIVLLLTSLPQAANAAGKPHSKYLVYVGTYTAKDSKGIYTYRLDSATGQLTSIGLAAATENPSFVVIHPNGRFLYAANELPKYQGKDSGAISAFSIDRATGKLTLLNQAPSGGADPCYLSFDRSGKHLLVANYTGGSVAVFPLQDDGKLGESSGFMQHKGSSLNPERQEGPHAHSIDLSADNRPRWKPEAAHGTSNFTLMESQHTSSVNCTIRSRHTPTTRKPAACILSRQSLLCHRTLLDTAKRQKYRSTPRVSSCTPQTEVMTALPSSKLMRRAEP